MSFYGFRKYTRKIQNALTGYSNLENLIREATNTDTWGPTTQQKRQLLNWILNYSSSQGSTSFNDIDLSQNIDPTYTHQVSQYTVDFIINRIREYSMHKPSTTVYERLKKNLVTKGYEFEIIVKCLNLLEYLLLNCFRTSGNRVTFDIADDVRMHTSTLKGLKSYNLKIAYDGLVLVHEKQVRQLAERILNLLDDEELLKSEREKFHPAMSKIEVQETEDDFLAERKYSDPFGRSRVSSISNTVGKMMTSPSSRRSRGSMGSVMLSQRGDEQDDADNNLISLTRGNEYQGYDYPGNSYNANKIGRDDVDDDDDDGYNDNVSAVEEDEEEDNAWAEEFGDLQNAGAKEPAKKTEKPVVDLLSSLGFEDLSVGNQPTKVPPIKVTNPIVQPATKPPVKSTSDNLFGDLLVDFKSKN
ncbi:DEKNAAC103570 [Brettanomyces naardenensis]|uniref:DEKNAAC103570 n=1 Tax=Brettanomyces naardenensis TaxID=13370 RepID=A0A448YNK7_BRENA|nr:DEKNAAC103570 [Brettanomyces naardenensis]